MELEVARKFGSAKTKARLGRARKSQTRLARTRPRGRSKGRPSRGSLKALLRIGEDLEKVAIWSTHICNSPDSIQPAISLVSARSMQDIEA